MLFASAKSVREESSKQRCALQDFSHIRVSLVKGKQGWRVGSVESLHNNFSVARDREVRGSVVAIYRLLRRFIRGEEACVPLFDFTVLALAEIQKPQPKRQLVDLFIQMHMLSLLGYVDESAIPTVLKERSLTNLAEWENEVSQSTVEKIVTKATENSHL